MWALSGLGSPLEPGADGAVAGRSASSVPRERAGVGPAGVRCKRAMGEATGRVGVARQSAAAPEPAVARSVTVALDPRVAVIGDQDDLEAVEVGLQLTTVRRPSAQARRASPVQASSHRVREASLAPGPATPQGARMP